MAHRKVTLLTSDIIIITSMEMRADYRDAQYLKKTKAEKRVRFQGMYLQVNSESVPTTPPAASSALFMFILIGRVTSLRPLMSACWPIGWSVAGLSVIISYNGGREVTPPCSQRSTS